MDTDNNIDIVITWVDGSDKEWLAERDYWRSKVARRTYSDNIASEVRFRDWGTLPFIFRGIELFAPWANHVFFVTYGHIPSWLNINNERLTIVRHEDFMPREYLPTFSSPAIEFCFNRIEGLSEKFVYLNDDTFILRPTMQEDFFIDNAPVLTPMESAITVVKDDLFFTQMVNAAIINEHFDKRSIQRRDWAKWLSPRIPFKARVSNMLMGIYSTYKAFEDPHIPSPYLKSTIDLLWELEKPMLEYVCSEKFRVLDGANLWLAKCWQLATGNYFVGKPLGQQYPRRNADFYSETKVIYDSIANQRSKVICLGDEACSKSDLDFRQKAIKEAFLQVFPVPSTFEVTASD